MTYYIIYKITNIINNKIYIGCHKTLDINDDYMGSGKILNQAKIKYGIEKFSKQILHVFNNSKEMYDKEAEIVNESFVASTRTYNIKIGGRGGFDYINNNKKNLYGNNGYTSNVKDNFARGKITLANRKKEDPVFAALISKKISDSLNGRPGTFNGKTHSEHTKKLIGEKSSIHQKGNKNSQYGKMWITNGIENKSIPKTTNIPEGWYKGRKITYNKAIDGTKH